MFSILRGKNRAKRAPKGQGPKTPTEFVIRTYMGCDGNVRAGRGRGREEGKEQKEDAFFASKTLL